MEEKAAGGLDSKPTPKNIAEKAQEVGAEAQESPQSNQDWLWCWVGQLIHLEALNVQDFLSSKQTRSKQRP